MLLAVDRSETDLSRSVSFKVIAAIATEEGVDPTAIEPPTYQSLYDVVDPEALDSLFATRENGTPRTTAGRVEFRFCGYDVVVTSDGEVSVAEPTPTQ